MFTLEYLIQFVIVFALVKLAWHARWRGTFTLKSAKTVKGSMSEIWKHLNLAKGKDGVLARAADKMPDNTRSASVRRVERLLWQPGHRQTYRTTLRGPDGKSALAHISFNGAETTQITTEQMPDGAVLVEIKVTEDRPALWCALLSLTLYNPATHILKNLSANVEQQAASPVIDKAVIGEAVAEG